MTPLRKIAFEGIRILGIGILYTCMGLIKIAARLDGQPITSEPPPTKKPEPYCQEHGNECSVCKARGAVSSKYIPDPVHAGKRQGKQMAKAIVDRGYVEPPTLPITWRCCHCDNFVCFNCTLVISGSVPIQFYEDTFCSARCRDAHNLCKTCNQPLTCKLITIDNDPADRKEEVWYCVNPMCQSVGLTEVAKA